MIKYELKKPIVNGTETITAFNLREEITAGDMRGLPMRDPMHHDEILKLVGRLSGQPDNVVNKLCITDYAELAQYVGVFMSDGQAIGT